MTYWPRAALTAVCVCCAAGVAADENLFGYLRGAETLPAGELELYNKTTSRDGKGTGSYHALDDEIELEYGVTDRFMMAASVSLLAVDTSGLSIDGALPGGEHTGLRFSGLELTGKYSILRPADDGLGVTLRASLERKWLDSLSGEDKDETELEIMLIAQQELMDGQWVLAANVGFGAGYEVKAPIAGLPPGFTWETEPEVDLGLRLGAGVSYRLVPGWYTGVETLYESKFESGPGLSAWSIFAGPSLHYASGRWWATLTWFPQVSGGGEEYPGQPDGQQLIFKTESELRLKLGFEL